MLSAVVGSAGLLKSAASAAAPAVAVAAQPSQHTLPTAPMPAVLFAAANRAVALGNAVAFAAAAAST
jgi:hypothetical protein